MEWLLGIEASKQEFGVSHYLQSGGYRRDIGWVTEVNLRNGHVTCENCLLVG